jgi:hypothetical protein
MTASPVTHWKTEQGEGQTRREFGRHEGPVWLFATAQVSPFPAALLPMRLAACAEYRRPIKARGSAFDCFFGLCAKASWRRSGPLELPLVHVLPVLTLNTLSSRHCSLTRRHSNVKHRGNLGADGRVKATHWSSVVGMFVYLLASSPMFPKLSIVQAVCALRLL